LRALFVDMFDGQERPNSARFIFLDSRVFHKTGSVTFGILVAFMGMLLTIFSTIALAIRLDRAWTLVRRASGYAQRKGALERIFVISMVLAGSTFFVWFLIHAGAVIDAPRSAHLSPVVVAFWSASGAG
jgi:hypothetical protein